MRMKLQLVEALILLSAISGFCQNVVKPIASQASPVIWAQPSDLRSRNLYYGSGGEKDQPHPPLKFVKEDMHGTNPKFVAEDSSGTKWTVKMGPEARPETAAAHLLWAVGYFTDEDYFVSHSEVSGLPSHLKRGQKLVTASGVQDVRLKRHDKKEDQWAWRSNPFSKSRELNGLRVMMALMNNWDLKDENNAVEIEKGSHRPIYLVSDLGASFGTTGFGFTFMGAKGNLESYSHTRFITKVTSSYVDLATPSRPALLYFPNLPGLIKRLRMRWIGRRVPREDAKWIGSLLAQLSPDQIRDAFRSAGFSPNEVEGFSSIVEKRIAELNRL